MNRPYEPDLADIKRQLRPSRIACSGLTLPAAAERVGYSLDGGQLYHTCPESGIRVAVGDASLRWLQTHYGEVAA